MKSLFIIFLLAVSISAYCQPATQAYVNHAIDSFSHTIDSTVVRPVKQTNGNVSVVLDTMSLTVNTAATFQVLVQTDSDNLIKVLYIKNTNGIYSILVDSDIKTFSFNTTRSFFSTTILYSVSASIVNNKVVIVGNGRKSTLMNWKLSKQQL